MRYITALLALVGFLLLLGAAGDSDRGAGTHIQERAAARRRSAGCRNLWT